MSARFALIGVVIGFTFLILFLWLFWHDSESPTGPPDEPAPVTKPDSSSPPIPALPAAAPPPVPQQRQAEPNAFEGAIVGTVLDHLGSPAGGSTVHIRQLAESATGATIPFTLETDSKGWFYFAALPPGMYGITATRGDYAAHASASIRPASPAAYVDLVLRRVGSIEGIVINESGDPVAGAELLPLTRDGHESGVVTAILTQVTGDDGRFRMDLLEPQLWTFQVEAEGYAPLITNEVPVGGPPVTFTLGSGGTLTIHVLDDATSQPIPECTLEVRNTENPKDLREARTDATGNIVLDHMAAGQYGIQSSHADFVLPEGIVLAEVFPSASVTPPVNLRMVRGAVIRGYVMDGDTREALPGVQIGAGSDAVRLAHNAYSDNTTGAYEIRGMPPGRITVRTWSTPAGYPNDDDTKTQAVIEAQPGMVYENVNFAFVKSIAISGMVVDADGRPVPGATVVATSEKWTEEGNRIAYDRHATANAQGAFEIFQVEPGYAATLRAETPSIRSELAGPYEIPPEGLTGITLVFDPKNTGAISGQVVDSAGKPIRAYVSAERTDTEGPRVNTSQVSDSEGYFVLTGLAPGTYQMGLGQYDPSGFNRITSDAGTVSLPVGRNVTGQRLILDESDRQSIAGFVMDDQGKALGHRVRVIAFSADEDGHAVYDTAGFSKTDGSFEITALPEGNYTVRVNDTTVTSDPVPNVPAGSTDVRLIAKPKGVAPN